MKNQKSKFVRVHTTFKHGEVAFIKSLLDAANIPYFITNENSSALGGGELDIVMDIMVPENNLEEAKELLKDLISPKNDSS